MGDYSHIAEIRATRGFSLLELLVTIAVAAILLAVAIPSYRSVVQRNAMAATVNDLVGDLNYARSQAVTRGQDVFVCSSNNQLNCNGGKDWSTGWVIYAAVDPSENSPTPTKDNRLRVHGPVGAGFQISAGGGSLSFNSSGFAMSGDTFTAKGNDVGQVTQVRVAVTGRVELVRRADDS